MASLTIPPFERYHVRVRKWRTTLSLDYCLAGLLAAKLGEEPGTAEAHRLVRAWLQGQVDESADISGLNRHIMRRAILAITDNMLSNRCAGWIDKISGNGSARLRSPIITPKTPVNISNPLGLAKETKKNGLNKGVGLGSRGHRRVKPRGPEATKNLIRPSKATPAKIIEKDRFVLYQSIFQLPPDIIDFGETVEDLRTRMKAREDSSIGGEDWRPDTPLGIIDKNEREKHGHHYIRRCSKACWDRLKEKGKKEIKPVADSDGVWRTRKEMAKIRRMNAWPEYVRRLQEEGRK